MAKFKPIKIKNGFKKMERWKRAKNKVTNPKKKKRKNHYKKKKRRMGNRKIFFKRIRVFFFFLSCKF